MAHISKKIIILGLQALFCFIFFPDYAAAQHASYSCQDERRGDNGTKCGGNAWHEDACEKCKPRLMFAVNPWQNCVSKTTISGTIFSYYITGYCHKDCLDYPELPKYYDDPAKPGVQAQGDNVKKIKLPVVLAWKDVRGFGDDSTKLAKCSASTDRNPAECEHTPDPGWITQNGNGNGPLSYRIQIWDDSDSGIDNINRLKTGPDPDTGLVNSGIETGVNGKSAFFAVLNKKGAEVGFNSRVHGNHCFFNATDTYHWRVKACCNADGTSCKDYKSDSGWTFTVGTAPEPIKPLDPDWNGVNAVSKSFKEITPAVEPLNWCKAKLSKEYQIPNRPVQYAKSYQLTMTSDENEKNGFADLLKNASSWYLKSAGVNPASAEQSIHALSIINGNLVYNVYPDKNTGEVETWYPAQSRGDLAFFSRGRNYSWKLTSCPDDFTKKCFPDVSQEWKIKTPGKYSIPSEIIPAPQAVTPKNDPDGSDPVGFPISLSWTVPSGANSFRYETDIPNLSGGERPTAWNVVPNNEFDDATRKMFDLNDAIMLDTTYKWRVRSCAMFDSGKSDINDCDNLSDWFFFRTTGRPPLKDSMFPNMDSVASYPQNFTWEKVPGAKSYNIELSTGTITKTKTIRFGPQDQGQPGTQFDYPDIQPPVDINIRAYTWKVQTCADENGKRCGAWGEPPQSFTTARPKSPQIQTQKKIYGSLNGVDLAWAGQTKQYWVTMNYIKPDLQTQPDCDLKNPIVARKINGNSCSMQNGCIPENIKTSCIGSYEWTVQPCANPDCSDTCANPDCSTKTNDNIKSGSFSVSANASETKTLSVCGQESDTTNSEWDETEVCGIKHIFLFLKIAVNFLLFKLFFLMLPVFALISGGWFYLSSGNPDTLKNVVKMWKAIGIGFGIMLMAWILTSWLLLAVGYSSFWWKIL